MVILGDKWEGEPIRVVRVEVDGKVLMLATDLDLEAELASLVLQLLSGKRPSKRAIELIRMYLMGYAEIDEVIPLLGLEKMDK